MANLIENAELSKKQTVGVEIETHGVQKDDFAHLVANYFYDTYGIPVCVWYDGRHHHDWRCIGKPAPDGSAREWVFCDDGSSSGPLGGIDCEMVSPILYDDEDIADLQAIVRLARKAGAKSGANYNAGVHIHIGADFDKVGGQNAKTIRNLVNLIKSHESLICKAINFTASRGHWAQWVDNDFLRALNAKKPTTKTGLFSLWYGSEREYLHVLNHRRECHYHHSRYHLLNLHSIIDKGTIEFRCFEFHDKLHAGELKAWIQLCRAMCSYAKIARNCRVKELQVDNPKYALNSWLKNMGLIGNEFKTCRKMLLKNLDGDSGYRNGRPATEPDDDVDDLALR